MMSVVMQEVTSSGGRAAVPAAVGPILTAEEFRSRPLKRRLAYVQIAVRLTSEVIGAAMADPDCRVRKHVAARKEIGLEELESLLEDRSCEVRAAALKRSDLLSIERIEGAFSDHSEVVRCQVLAVLRELGATRVLDRAIADRSSRVRESAVRLFANDMSNEQIDSVLSDQDVLVRVAVVESRKRLSQEQLVVALADWSRAVRAVAIQHKDQFTVEMLDQLCAVRVRKMVERCL